MKLDMQKAYNKVDWGFLAALMMKMGFHKRWVNWIRACVSTMEYRVVLNGKNQFHSNHYMDFDKVIRSFQSIYIGI